MKIKRLIKEIRHLQDTIRKEESDLISIKSDILYDILELNIQYLKLIEDGSIKMIEEKEDQVN